MATTTTKNNGHRQQQQHQQQRQQQQRLGTMKQRNLLVFCINSVIAFTANRGLTFCALQPPRRVRAPLFSSGTDDGYVCLGSWSCRRLPLSVYHLRHEDIARCNKGNSAIFIPNVIVVQDKSGKVSVVCFCVFVFIHVVVLFDVAVRVAEPRLCSGKRTFILPCLL